MESVMTNRVACGAVHNTENLEAYKSLLEELLKNGVKKVGMELPFNWRSKKDDGFWKPLAEHAEKIGLKVIGIDSPIAYKQTVLVDNALTIQEEFSKEVIQKGIAQLSELENQPATGLTEAETKKLKEMMRTYRLAASKNRGELVNAFRALTLLRNQYMSNQIRKNGLGVVLVGGAHAIWISKAMGWRFHDHQRLVEKTKRKVERGWEAMTKGDQFTRLWMVSRKLGKRKTPKPKLPK